MKINVTYIPSFYRMGTPQDTLEPGDTDQHGKHYSDEAAYEAEAERQNKLWNAYSKTEKVPF